MIILVTVLLESIDLLLLQLWVTKPKLMAQACRPTVYTYKTSYFNHVDISASFKNFIKITPTCFRDHKIGYAPPIYKCIEKAHLQTLING